MSTLKSGILKGVLSDFELNALASTVSASDKLPYFTGAGTATTTSITVAARALLDDIDAATMRSTLDVEQHKESLTAIGSVTSSVDTIPYFTGVGTASKTSFTSAARALLDDIDAAAMRSTLGLVIGTNVQAYDAELSALASVTSAADTIPYFTGSGTASVTSFTPQARTLLAATTSAAQCSIVGAANTGKAIAMAIVFGG